MVKQPSNFPSTHMITVILARQQASTSHKTTHNIRHNSTIQVCHYHNIKLVRLSNQLHAAVINDHVIVLNVRVITCYLAGCLQEQTIRQLPEIEQKPTSFLGLMSLFYICFSLQLSLSGQHWHCTEICKPLNTWCHKWGTVSLYFRLMKQNVVFFNSWFHAL